MIDFDFGRDDGIKCECGGKTFLVDDQGYGLKAYECEVCERTFQVQFDWDHEEPDHDYYEPPFEELED